MRALGCFPLTALILTGLPPAPIGPVSAAQSGARTVRPVQGEDPDARCPPFLEGFRNDYDRQRRLRPNRGHRQPGATPEPPGDERAALAAAAASPPPAATAAASRRPMAMQEMRQQTPTQGQRVGILGQAPLQRYVPSPDNRERYSGEEVAAVQAVADAPVSTFSIDVDTGSYANVRRMLNGGQMPPQAAVRTEEMLNYFRYDYPAPRDRSRPFSRLDRHERRRRGTRRPGCCASACAATICRAQGRPAANLVFLVDVSGSMAQPDKLPLVQCSLALLADRLNPRDRVSIVVYAGAAGDRAAADFRPRTRSSNR